MGGWSEAGPAMTLLVLLAHDPGVDVLRNLVATMRGGWR